MSAGNDASPMNTSMRKQDASKPAGEASGANSNGDATPSLTEVTAATADSDSRANSRQTNWSAEEVEGLKRKKIGRNSNYLSAARESTGYLEISDYATIGNLRTAALVARDGSIDSFCFPYFDSPSVFARILDKDIGGHFSIQPMCQQTHSKQQYLPNSAIISTKFLSDEGVCVVTDFMPRPNPTSRSDKPLLPWLVRRVEVIRGSLPFRLECFPAFDYARQEHTTTLVDDDKCEKDGLTGKKRQKAVFKSELMKLELRSVTACDESIDPEMPPPDVHFDINSDAWPRHKGPGVIAEFTLSEGQRAEFILREEPESAEDVSGVPSAKAATDDKAPILERDGKDGLTIKAKKFDLVNIDPWLDGNLIQSLQDATQAYWYGWIKQSKYDGRWREFVHRSAITLKLLTFELTGAIVAAATFSLPEGMKGEGRNWDYRFSWARDGSFTVYALIRLGFTSEAVAYMEFIQTKIQSTKKGQPMQIMFGIREESSLEEIELDHLEGYKGQRPVRIGNGAADHLQLDTSGELMDAIYLTNKFAKPCSWELWKSVRTIVDWVVENYDQPDMSIWEVRNQKQNFVYSKIMMWVAIDRGLRLAEKRSFPCPNRALWYKTRDTIYEEIQEKGWNEEKGYYCQSYENKECLDASVLIMPLVFFCSPVDPRFLSTLDWVLKTPEKGGLTTNHLVYRYDTEKSQDGVGGEEGAFLMCACWAVECLTRSGQHDKRLLDKARVMFEDIMSYGNHVGAFSEELSKSGEALGNYPQAFVSVAIISAAFNLDRVLSGKSAGQ